MVKLSTVLSLVGLLLTAGCGSQAGGGPRVGTTSPGSHEGACSILVGQDELVQRTLAFGHRPVGERDARTLMHLQDRLFSVVVAHARGLWSAAGQLVDYLDDPDAYNRGNGTSPRVESAVARIRTECGRD